MELLNKILIYIKDKKYIIIGIFVILVVLGIVVKLAILGPNKIVTTTPASLPIQTQEIKIMSTSPTNGQTNVSNGEILISFTTNFPVSSQKELSINIAPKIPYYWKYENLFPSTNIKLRIYGGLTPGTQYAVSVKDASKRLLAQWSFTTSSSPAVSAPLIGQDKTRQEIHDKFQLVPYVPYSNSDFYIDYSGDNVNDNTLEVEIENPDKTQDQIKQEVNNWIKSHNVDPSTQKIKYVNDF